MQLNASKFNEVKFAEQTRIQFVITLQSFRAQSSSFSSTFSAARIQTASATEISQTARKTVLSSDSEFQTSRQILAQIIKNSSTLRETTAESPAIFQTNRTVVLARESTFSTRRSTSSTSQSAVQCARSLASAFQTQLATSRSISQAGFFTYQSARYLSRSLELSVQTVRTLLVSGGASENTLALVRKLSNPQSANFQTARTLQLHETDTQQTIRELLRDTTIISQTHRGVVALSQLTLDAKVETNALISKSHQTQRLMAGLISFTGSCQRISQVQLDKTLQTLRNVALTFQNVSDQIRFVYGLVGFVAQTLRRTSTSQQEQFDQTLQTRLEIVGLKHNLGQTIRSTQIEAQHSLQTILKMVLPSSEVLSALITTVRSHMYVFRTIRKIAGLTSRSKQCVRIKQIQSEILSQTARQVVQLQIAILDARRFAFGLKSYDLQTLRKVQLTFLQLYQGHRSVYRLHLQIKDYFAQLSFNALELKFLGTIEIKRDGTIVDLEPIILFPGEKRLFSIKVKNSSGNYVRNLQLQHIPDEDNESEIQNHMFGLVNGRVVQNLVRVSAGLEPDKLKKIPFDGDVILKTDALNDGDELLVYLEVEQPDDLIPITHLDLAFIYKMQLDTQ